MVAADARTALTFSLSPGQAHDAPEGRALLNKLGPTPEPLHLVMDRAYEGDETRQLALDFGFIPVVPPKQNRVHAFRVRPGNLQASKRDRAAVSPAQRISPHLLKIRKARRGFHRVHPLRSHRRSSPLVLTGPSWNWALPCGHRSSRRTLRLLCDLCEKLPGKHAFHGVLGRRRGTGFHAENAKETRRTQRKCQDSTSWR